MNDTANKPWGVLVLDYGSQYTQLIARRIRELGVYSEIHPYFTAPSKITSFTPRALILSGGPASVGDHNSPSLDSEWLLQGLPVLGICYGMQLIAHNSGGRVGQAVSREFGHAVLTVDDSSSLFAGFSVGEKISVWMSHGDHVDELPPGFATLASSEGAPVAAFGNKEKRIYGVQFHPEVVHSPRGKEILSNFLFKISGLTTNWSAQHFISETVERLKREIPADAEVLCALSGGVDSTVAASLLHRAIGDRLQCVFVDNGVLRKNEVRFVVESLGEQGLGLKLKVAHAADRFLGALAGITDPEEKRKTIGRLFIEVFEDEIKDLNRVQFLVQGTLYPDVIESVSINGPSATIKSHHNVGGLPEKMKFKLIEPLRELFKDEVRAVGRELGVPANLIDRHPFPGPGLAVRILGEVTAERVAILQNADAIFMEELRAEGLYGTIWQALSVLLPVKSVGVMGDSRTYEQAVVLRAVTSEDGMTADWAYLPHEMLRRVSNRIINEVKGINRVAYDISSKPPATIEWE